MHTATPSFNCMGSGESNPFTRMVLTEPYPQLQSDLCPPLLLLFNPNSQAYLPAGVNTPNSFLLLSLTPTSKACQCCFPAWPEPPHIIPSPGPSSILPLAATILHSLSHEVLPALPGLCSSQPSGHLSSPSKSSDLLPGLWTGYSHFLLRAAAPAVFLQLEACVPGLAHLILLRASV